MSLTRDRLFRIITVRLQETNSLVMLLEDSNPTVSTPFAGYQLQRISFISHIHYL
jgi:hypothetical protein